MHSTAPLISSHVRNMPLCVCGPFFSTVLGLMPQGLCNFWYFYCMFADIWQHTRLCASPRLCQCLARAAQRYAAVAVYNEQPADIYASLQRNKTQFGAYFTSSKMSQYQLELCCMPVSLRSTACTLLGHMQALTTSQLGLVSAL